MNIFGRISILKNTPYLDCKSFALIWGAIFLLAPNAGGAHVKWFVTSEGAHANAHFQADALSLALVAGFIMFLLFCYWLDGRANTKSAVQSILYLTSGKLDVAWVALKFSVAVLFTANIMQNNFIAPNFVSSPSQHQIALQGALVIALILHADLFVALLMFFAIISMVIYPFSSAIDYSIELIALALAIYFLNPLRMNKLYKIQLTTVSIYQHGAQIGFALLRFGLGAQLIVLTLHDKFFHPGLALEFLRLHPDFNFVRLLGFSGFSDLHFVLAAGLAELAFGVALVTNMAVRLALLLILFFFITTGIALGIEELVGHVPIVIAALVLFFFPSQKSVNIQANAIDWQSEVKRQSSDLP